MILTSIGILVGLAFWLLKSILTPQSGQSADKSGAVLPWHSDYKQLRIESYQSIDTSLSPPRH